MGEVIARYATSFGVATWEICAKIVQYISFVPINDCHVCIRPAVFRSQFVVNVVVEPFGQCDVSFHLLLTSATSNGT